MKILLDTNVLISAFVFGGKAGQLLEKLFDSDFELLVSDYVNKEFHDKLNEKWPEVNKNRLTKSQQTTNACILKENVVYLLI